jgi:hypothetical protein
MIPWIFSHILLFRYCTSTDDRAEKHRFTNERTNLAAGIMEILPRCLLWKGWRASRTVQVVPGLHIFYNEIHDAWNFMIPWIFSHVLLFKYWRSSREASIQQSKDEFWQLESWRFCHVLLCKRWRVSLEESTSSTRSTCLLQRDSWRPKFHDSMNLFPRTFFCSSTDDPAEKHLLWRILADGLM